jgi:hypothetical protein
MNRIRTWGLLALLLALLAVLLPASAGATVKKATVPGRPVVAVSAATTTGVGSTVYSATITWSTPADGGSAITGYAVSRDGRDTNGGGAYSTTVAASKHSFTFTLLGVGSPYTFSVAAINKVGRGPAGTASGWPPEPAATDVSVLTAQYPGLSYQASNGGYGGVAVRFTCQRGLHWSADALLAQPAFGARAGASGIANFSGTRNGTCTGAPTIAVVVVADVSGWHGGTEKPFHEDFATATGYIYTSVVSDGIHIHGFGQAQVAKSVFLI